MKTYTNIINRLTLKEKINLVFLVGQELSGIDDLNIPNAIFKEFAIPSSLAYVSDLKVIESYADVYKNSSNIVYTLNYKNMYSDNSFYNDLIYESLLKGLTKNNFVLVSNCKYEFSNVIYSFADEITEEHDYMALSSLDYNNIITAINKGVTFVFTNNEIKETIFKVYSDLEAKDLALKRKEITEKDYNEWVSEHNGISLLNLNLAVNKVLNILDITCVKEELDANQVSTNLYNEENLKLRLARDSIVLLKNDNILPLVAGQKVCLIGNLALDLANEFESDLYELIKIEKAWEQDGYIDDLILQKITDESANCDLVILGLDCEALDKLNIGQKKVTDVLRSTRAKVVVVLNTNKDFDFTYLEDFNAILYLPEIYHNTKIHLAEIITNKYNPCGHLAKKLANYLTFTGLNYNNFNYDRLTIVNNEIAFVAANKGNLAANMTYYAQIKENEKNIMLLTTNINISSNQSDMVYLKLTKPLTGPNYNISISEGNNLLLEGSLTNKTIKKSEYEEEEFVGHIETKQNNNFILPYILKIIIIIASTICLALLFGTMYRNDERVPFCYISLALTIISIVGGIGLFALSTIGLVKNLKVKEKAVDLRIFKEFADEVRVTFTKPLTEEETTVEEETKKQEIVKPKEAVYSIETDEIKNTTNVNFSNFVVDFIEYLKNNGIVTNYLTIRNLLAGLAMTKLIILPKSPLIYRFLTCLQEFLGVECNYINYDENNHLLYKRLDVEHNEYIMTDVARTLLKAKNNQQQMFVSVIEASDKSFITSFQVELANIQSNDKFYLKLDEYEQILLPKNIWYFIITDNLDGDLIEKGILLNPILEEGLAKENHVLATPKNINAFRSEVRIARNNSYLSENSWHKLDNFFDYVKEKTNYVFKNSLILNIEAYTAVYYELNKDEDETLDLLLANKLIPLLKTLPYFSEDNTKSKLKEMLDLCFKETNLEHTLRILN